MRNDPEREVEAEAEVEVGGRKQEAGNSAAVPQSRSTAEDNKLTDEELEQVAGGTFPLRDIFDSSIDKDKCRIISAGH